MSHPIKTTSIDTRNRFRYIMHAQFNFYRHIFHANSQYNSNQVHWFAKRWHIQSHYKFALIEMRAILLISQVYRLNWCYWLSQICFSLFFFWCDINLTLASKCKLNAFHNSLCFVFFFVCVASMATDDKLKRTVKIENVDTRQSPPKAIVDCSPLQPAISKNKEGTHFIHLEK